MLNKEEIEQIERYIEGVESADESEWVESLFINDGEGNKDLRQLLINEWNNTSNKIDEQDAKLLATLDKIHHIIRKKENSKRNAPLKRFVKLYSRVAAILLFPLAIAGVILFNSMRDYSKPEKSEIVTSKIYAPIGSRVSFILPDSTFGMLNSGSSISYKLPFKDKRELTLEGEAWFEVAYDDEHPFKVHAGQSIVKVLGTSFNLNSDSAGNYLELVLLNGRVEFQAGIDREVLTLNPSEKLSFYNGHVNKEKVNPAKYNAWTEGKLIFRGDRMGEVVRRLERWYNVDIVIEDKELEKYSFRATFQDDSFEEVLECLAMTSPIGYKINPGKLLSDGTYKKKEIRIYKLRL